MGMLRFFLMVVYGHLEWHLPWIYAFNSGLVIFHDPLVVKAGSWKRSRNKSCLVNFPFSPGGVGEAFGRKAWLENLEVIYQKKTSPQSFMM